MLKYLSHKIAKKALFCYSSILFYSENINVSVTSEKIRYFFTVEKYQFYSHLICIEFTACDKIKTTGGLYNYGKRYDVHNNVEYIMTKL